MCFKYVFIPLPLASFARSQRRQHICFYTKHTEYLARKKIMHWICVSLVFAICFLFAKKKKTIYPFGLDGQIRSAQILNDASAKTRAYVIVIIILGENHIVNEKWKLLRIIEKWFDAFEWMWALWLGYPELSVRLDHSIIIYILWAFIFSIHSPSILFMSLSIFLLCELWILMAVMHQNTQKHVICIIASFNDIVKF